MPAPTSLDQMNITFTAFRKEGHTSEWQVLIIHQLCSAVLESLSTCERAYASQINIACAHWNLLLWILLCAYSLGKMYYLLVKEHGLSHVSVDLLCLPDTLKDRIE